MWTLIMIVICVGIGAAYRSITKKKEEDVKAEQTASNAMPTTAEPTVFEMAEHPFREMLLKELGVEIKNTSEDKCRYIVGYQGGYFDFIFGKQNRYIKIIYYSFYSCSKKDLQTAYAVANTINLNQGNWTCYLSQSEEVCETPIDANICYLFSAQGSVKVCAEALRILLPMCFEHAREFTELMETALKEQESVAEHHNDGVFNMQMQLVRNRRAIGHSHEEMGEEYPIKESQTISGFMKLFQDVDLGCMQQMKLLVDDGLEVVTEPTQIMEFDIREYIKNHPRQTDLKNLTILLEFEKQNLVINLNRVSGEAAKTLFFSYCVMRAGAQIDYELDKANVGPTFFKGLIEVRLTTENEDYWEAKYIVDDAMDKWNNGKAKELTDEQRMIVACVSPSTRMDMYWAKKYYNDRCLLQSLPYFKRIVHNIKQHTSTPDSPYRDLYNELNFYIGFIYMELKMYETAYYYLDIAQRGGNFSSIEEFMNCLCNVRDWDSLTYIRDIYERIIKALKEEGEDANDNLLRLYQFTKRRMAYALINNRELDEAKNMLKEMIKNGEDVEFAKVELKYIHTLNKS